MFASEEKTRMKYHIIQGKTLNTTLNYLYRRRTKWKHKHKTRYY